MTKALKARPVDKIKDPQATLDYGFKYEEWLDPAVSEVIVTSTWAVDVGLTIEASPPPTTIIGGNTTAVWISGGTAGENYLLTNTITTDVGRIDERSYKIHIVNR